MSLRVVILAAGQGSRMDSPIPKVLHVLAGKTLLEHAVSKALYFTRTPLVVCGHDATALKETLKAISLKWIEQEKPQGTGHALLQAVKQLNNEDQVLVFYGDTPLISPKTLKRLIDRTPAQGLGMVTAYLNQPKGYGRILRNRKDDIIAVIEEKELLPEHTQIQEVNGGIYFAAASLFKKYLPQIKNNNHKKEFYLTDLIGLCVEDRVPIITVEPKYTHEIMGVNRQTELAHLEKLLKHKRKLVLSQEVH